MSNHCSKCGSANFTAAKDCSRCGSWLGIERRGSRTFGAKLARRATVFVLVCVTLLAGFYLSLIGSANRLTLIQKQSMRSAVAIVRQKGFTDEALLLENLAAFRSSDNWLNASVAKENAYAATNFPFEIVTLYPDFFTYPADDTERAAILLHEARHLAGKDEHDAYEFVWKHRQQLGWTAEFYRESPVWQNVRRQTQENVPELFVCDRSEAGDCTQ
ncbi:MAG: hypothetical protein ABJA02_01275 [Acidobacteriota bacterium]